MKDGIEVRIFFFGVLKYSVGVKELFWFGRLLRENLGEDFFPLRLSR
jgi:hypothetical protein